MSRPAGIPGHCLIQGDDVCGREDPPSLIPPPNIFHRVSLVFHKQSRQYLNTRSHFPDFTVSPISEKQTTTEPRITVTIDFI